MKKKYKNLEITCLGKRIHTGVDVDIILDGKRIGAKYLIWEIGPIDWNGGFGHLEIGGTEKGTITVDYPIKKMELQFKAFDVISDNTSLGTGIIRNGKNIISELSVSKLKWDVYGSDRINELEIKMC